MMEYKEGFSDREPDILSRYSERNSRELRTLFENASVGITVAASGILVEVNEAFCRFIGYSREELRGKEILEITHPEDRPGTVRFFRRVLKGRSTPFDEEKRYLHKSGATLWARTTVSWISDQETGEIYGIGLVQDITERKAAEDKIYRMAFYDSLTGLPNRTLILDRIRQILDRARHQESSAALLFFDLDNFKKINDTLGHEAGDELLVAVSERLRSCMRKCDTVGRLGGDEFLVLISGIRDREDAAAMAHHILGALSKPFRLKGSDFFISASGGIALYPEDGSEMSALLRHANLALHESKSKGRNHYRFFSGELNERAVERLDLETDLRKALRDNRFLLHFQPQISLNAGKIIGVEALIRFRNTDDRLVYPAEFISLAEQIGLIFPIGEWVLKAACLQNRIWQNAGYPPVRMCVNLSAAQFLQSSFVSMVEKILDETGLDPRWLELELTESILAEAGPDTMSKLKSLKDMGIRLAIDDFGTGYSSLAYLKRFPIDRLKIPLEFVRGVPDDSNDAALVRTIVRMAEGLNLETIAEGVENPGQLKFLLGLGCAEMQGYYFSRPLPPDDIGAYMETQGRFDSCPFGLKSPLVHS